MTEWPSNYDPSTRTAPTLTPAQCMVLGSELALKLTLDKKVAADYLAVVKKHYRNPSDDLLSRYAALISSLGLSVDTATINHHDFANIHRAAWLRIVRALARLVALNPFQSNMNDNEWANPPQLGTERQVDLPTAHGSFFFKIPNASGYYALSSTAFDDYEEIAVGELAKEPFLAGTSSTAANPAA